MFKQLISYVIVAISIVIVLAGVANAEQATQDVVVERSGGILLKAQRQQKTDNTHQKVVIKKSGGIIVIIQRNINKVVREDKVDEQ